MLAPKVTFSCESYFFQIVIYQMQDCGSPLVLHLCALGSGRALIYDELYINLSDIKGAKVLLD